MTLTCGKRHWITNEKNHQFILLKFEHFHCLREFMTRQQLDYNNQSLILVSGLRDEAIG